MTEQDRPCTLQRRRLLGAVDAGTAPALAGCWTGLLNRDGASGGDGTDREPTPYEPSGSPAFQRWFPENGWNWQRDALQPLLYLDTVRYDDVKSGLSDEALSTVTNWRGRFPWKLIEAAVISPGGELYGRAKGSVANVTTYLRNDGWTEVEGSSPDDEVRAFRGDSLVVVGPSTVAALELPASSSSQADVANLARSVRRTLRSADGGDPPSGLRSAAVGKPAIGVFGRAGFLPGDPALSSVSGTAAAWRFEEGSAAARFAVVFETPDDADADRVREWVDSTPAVDVSAYGTTTVRRDGRVVTVDGTTDVGSVGWLGLLG